MGYKLAQKGNYVSGPEMLSFVALLPEISGKMYQSFSWCALQLPSITALQKITLTPRVPRSTHFSCHAQLKENPQQNSYPVPNRYFYQHHLHRADPSSFLNHIQKIANNS